jgi:hypothetical protein
MTKNKNIINRDFSFCSANNSKEEFDKSDAANKIRLLNMNRTNYDSKNKANLKFATFDNNSEPDPNLAFDLTASSLQLLSLKQQSERFPKKYISDFPAKLKYKIGLPSNNSFSSSSSEEKYKNPKKSSDSSDIFLDSENERNWTEVKNKNPLKNLNFSSKNQSKKSKY